MTRKSDVVYRECFFCRRFWDRSLMFEVPIETYGDTDKVNSMGSYGERAFKCIYEWLCPDCYENKLFGNKKPG